MDDHKAEIARLTERLRASEEFSRMQGRELRWWRERAEDAERNAEAAQCEVARLLDRESEWWQQNSAIIAAEVGARRRAEAAEREAAELQSALEIMDPRHKKGGTVGSPPELRAGEVSARECKVVSRLRSLCRWRRAKPLSADEVG